MTRRIYIALLKLHPRSFRERFAEEMIGIFDEEQKGGTPLGLLADAATSLVRQRAFRAPRIVAAPAPADGLPLFQTFEPEFLRLSVFIPGAVLTLLCFAGLSLAVGRRGGSLPSFTIGSKRSYASLLSFDRSSVAAAEPSTEIKVRPPEPDSMDEQAKAYFNAIRVLNALDLNDDRVLSGTEIAAASKALRGIDWNRDGELDAEECGFFVGRSGLASGEIDQARTLFMRANPVLAALDDNQNGRISDGEIETAAVSLKSLDRNRDGSITPIEVLPHEPETGKPSASPDFPSSNR